MIFVYLGFVFPYLADLGRGAIAALRLYRKVV